MIPQGNGLLEEAIIHLGREPRSKSASRGLAHLSRGFVWAGSRRPIRYQKLRRRRSALLRVGVLGGSGLDFGGDAFQVTFEGRQGPVVILRGHLDGLLEVFRGKVKLAGSF